MIGLACKPLTAPAYAPYGHVIMASPHGEEGRAANQGTARRWGHLAPIDNLRPATAKLNVSVFRCTPRRAWPLRIAALEKHPASTQAFLPMRARRYLVVVALGAERPDLSTLTAFVASGSQGITYHPGVWHHPMIALDEETDFTCLVWEDDSEMDCVEVAYLDGEQRVIAEP